MNLVNQSAFLKALGWSLLDSLWQLGVLWLVYVCLTANGKRYQSRQRHTLALVTLAGGSIWFLATLVMNFYQAAVAPATVTIVVQEGTTVSSQMPLLARIASWFDPALPFLSVAYLLAACFLFIRFYRQYRFTQQLFKQELQKAHPEWRVFLQKAAAHMGIKKKVTIWFSSLADTPLTLGFLKPLILLPVAAINHLSTQQAEAIILHELNHIRRNDYLVNLLIACVDIILFFNPFARLLTSIIRKERENSCDDMVLQFRYDAKNYACALLTLEKNREAGNPALAVAATGKDNQLLLNRVKRILTNEPVTTSVHQKFFAYLVSALLIGFIGWYNPGKVIVKKIAEVTTPVADPVATEVDNNSFVTPPPTPLTLVKISTPAKEEKKIVKDNAKKIWKDNYKKLEALIEWTADARLAELKTRIGETPEEIAGYASNYNYEYNDYTLQKAKVTMVPDVVLDAYPYVPTSSFSYQVVEDTTLPKKYILTYEEQKAKEAIDKALVALKGLDWKKLEKELTVNGKTINIEQLKEELNKAIKEIDLKKLSAEASEDLNDVTEELKDQGEAFTVQLGNYQRERIVRQQRIKSAQNQVLLDRLEQHERLKKLEEEEKTKKSSCTGTATTTRKTTATKKVKKIVEI